MAKRLENPEARFRRQVCENMEVYAKSYLETPIETEILETETVLLDSINYVGRCIDYRTFYDMFRKFNVDTTMIDPEVLLSTLKDEYSQYYEYGIKKSIEENEDCYACSGNLYIYEDSALDMLTNYLSYIANVNGLNQDIKKSDITKAKSRIKQRIVPKKRLQQ